MTLKRTKALSQEADGPVRQQKYQPNVDNRVTKITVTPLSAFMQSKESKGKTCKSFRKSVKTLGACCQNYSTKNCRAKDSKCKVSQEKSHKDGLAGQSVTQR